ncbi:MAG: DNA polymerase III subunit gamma/tau [Robiginitomaculum sp.]|nr:DNA polymerase III subunit gamma/tau [Robiginitomaculum sp.]
MSESDIEETTETTETNERENPDQDSMFADGETGAGKTMAKETIATYQVLARKYRPSNFSDLIGQQPMVHTLTNAFAAGRIAHAFMLTGVRGVGKTTTARLLARALNYQSETIDKPAMNLDPPGVHCQQITASRHMDVMEMDAASHTGIADIREILDGVRYAPVSARYKVYIIDEVHMLSKPAFNALLKTLEEPPPHAIFILATTEIRKVPVTILSRCQRFDLARVGAEEMVSHLQRIAKIEGYRVNKAGLNLIARASEGSVRDALSILDQALVQSSDTEIAAEDIRLMLGLADRGRVLDLFALVMRADVSGALGELREQYEMGADPVVITTDLLDHCHQITRAKALDEAADLSEYGSAADLVRELAGTLSMGQLTRSWQMLLKASGEIRVAPDPLAALEMALIRLCVAADLPSPEDAARQLRNNNNKTTEPAQNQTASATQKEGSAPKAVGNLAIATQSVQDPQPVLETKQETQPKAPQTFTQLLQLLEEKRELPVLNQLESYVRLISYQPGAISFAPQTGAPDNLATELSQQLQTITGISWLISSDKNGQGEDTVLQLRNEAKKQDLEKTLADENVQGVLAAFSQAKIIRILDPEN